jgi:tetrapyrrole methylase family protein/MazG family protein/ATP diphosphatase
MKDPDTLEEISGAFARMVDLIRTLCSENGCPWDRKQTPETVHPYILEEYHEMVQAMNGGRKDEIADEVGDLLFMVVFIGHLFRRQGVTTLTEILERVTGKMRRRHPHVFGDVVARDADEVVVNWAKIKASEPNMRERESLLDGIPRSLPALSRAQKLARRASRAGFDWKRPEDVFEKVDEEVAELKRAAAEGSTERIREELGDLLFVAANAARLFNTDGEAALNETSDKFERRFRFIEAALRARGKSPEDADLEEMDELWDEAKAEESAAGK